MYATLRAINIGLSLIAPVIPERSSNPALTAALIEPRPGALLLSGGWDVPALVYVPAETAPGDTVPALIGAHLLRELLRVSPGDLVELRTVAPSLGDGGHTRPGRLDFRAGSFEVTLESGDVDRAPVPLDSDDFAGLTFGAPVDLSAVRAALNIAPKSTYSSWDQYAFLTGGAVGTSDGVKIGRADLDVPGVSAPVAVPAASLLSALRGVQADAVVRVAVIGDGSGLVVRVEHCGVWMLARVPVCDSIAAPESLLLTLAGEVGPVLAHLPALDPSSNPARKLDKRGNLTAARPWTAAQIRAAVRGVGVLGLLPCGTYEGVQADGGSVQALPGAGEGVPGHVVVMHGARLAELGTAGGTLHTPAAFGGRHVFRAAGGTVGALGHTVLNVSRPGLVTLDAWREIRRELRGAYWSGRASDLRGLLVNLDWSFGAFSEASRIIAEYADLHAAARADGYTLQAGPDWAREIVRGVVESRRAARERARGVLGRTWGAAVKAAGGVRDWEARTVPEIGKNGTPKRVPVALTRALTEARGAFTRAAVAVTEAGLEYLNAMTAHGAALGAAALLFPESFRPGRVLGAPLDAGDVMTRAAAVHDRRAAARARRAGGPAALGAVEPDTTPAPADVVPEVDPVAAYLGALTPAAPDLGAPPPESVVYRVGDVRDSHRVNAAGHVRAALAAGVIPGPGVDGVAWFSGADNLSAPEWAHPVPGFKFERAFKKSGGWRPCVTVQLCAGGRLVFVSATTGDGVNGSETGRSALIDPARLNAGLRAAGITGRYAIEARGLVQYLQGRAAEAARAAAEVEPAPSPAPAALRDEPAYVQAAGLIAAARPDLRAARAAGAGAGVIPGVRARAALLDAASHLRGTLDAFTPGALVDRAERIAAGWERAADVLPCLHGARWTLARLVAGKRGGRVHLLPGVNGAAGLAAPREAYHAARPFLLTLAGVQARRAALVPFPAPAPVAAPEVEPAPVPVVPDVERAPVALNAAGPVAAYHLARPYLLTLAGVQARRAALVPFPVLQAPADVERRAAGDPAAVLGALEALALVPGGDLVELGARVAAGDPAALQAGAAAAVILAALRAPWRARGADVPGVLVVAGGPGIEPPPTPGGPGGAGRGGALGGADVERAPTPAAVPDTAPGGPVGVVDTAPDTAPGGPDNEVAPEVVPDTAPVGPAYAVEVAVAGSRGVVSAVIERGGRVTITAGGVSYPGTYDRRGAVTCPGGWVEVAGRRVLELRGQIAEKARREGWAQ